MREMLCVTYERVRGGYRVGMAVGSTRQVADDVMFVKVSEFPTCNAGFERLEAEAYERFAPDAMRMFGIDVSKTRMVEA